MEHPDTSFYELTHSLAEIMKWVGMYVSACCCMEGKTFADPEVLSKLFYPPG